MFTVQHFGTCSKWQEAVLVRTTDPGCQTDGLPVQHTQAFVPCENSSWFYFTKHRRFGLGCFGPLQPCHSEVHCTASIVETSLNWWRERQYPPWSHQSSWMNLFFICWSTEAAAALGTCDPLKQARTPRFYPKLDWTFAFSSPSRTPVTLNAETFFVQTPNQRWAN